MEVFKIVLRDGFNKSIIFIEATNFELMFYKLRERLKEQDSFNTNHIESIKVQEAVELIK